jgi:hypothetical protein
MDSHEVKFGLYNLGEFCSVLERLFPWKKKNNETPDSFLTFRKKVHRLGILFSCTCAQMLAK